MGGPDTQQALWRPPNASRTFAPVPTPFSRTLRALDDDERGTAWTGAIAAALLAAWLAWFVASPVAVYETTDVARVEASQDVHAVQAPVAGRVVGCRTALGQVVRAGDVICELESTVEQSRLTEERAHALSLARQIEAARAELASDERAVTQDRDARLAAVDEANAEAREAAAAAHRSTDEAARLAPLRASGRLSELEYGKIQSDADVQRAAADAKQIHARRLELERQSAASERRAAIERVQRELAQLGAERATAEATIQVLETEIERHTLRAPVSGRVGEVARVRPGAVVAAGDRLADVVPDGALRIVAEFGPAAALGRIRAGQPARFRLAGFPSSQYGTIAARVLRVAMEPRDGAIRVELALAPNGPPNGPPNGSPNGSPNAAVALRHGLPGRVEVELERVSPATLVLRAAGRLVTRQPLTAAGS